jgi:HK97 family phage portal protein
MKQAADEAAGRYRSGGTMVMSNGMRPVDFRPGVTATEADVIAGLNFSIQEIARAFGIPVALLAQEKDQSFATAAEASRQFAMVTVAPWLNRLSDELSIKLLSQDERAAGARVEFDLADALLGHGRERAETLSTMVNAGILSPNEARNLSGLPDIEHGEVLRAPTNTFPLERWATSQTAATNDGGSADVG